MFTCRHQLVDKPRRLYILDETEICIPYRPGSTAPFPDKLTDALGRLDDGSNSQDGVDTLSAADKKRMVSKNVTLYGCGNAVGKVLKPFFACLSNLRKTEEVLVNCQGHRGLMLGKWKNGEEIFQYYIENHFRCQVSLDDSRPVLLLFDAHKAKPSDATIRWARENQIILFPLPPHVHQLPDVGCLEHFKDSFEEECISFLEDFIVDDLVNRNHACNIAGRIYPEVVSPDNLIACFRKIGVYPFNPRIVDPNASILSTRSGVKDSLENDLEMVVSASESGTSRGGMKVKLKKVSKKSPVQCSKDMISEFFKKKNPYMLTDQALREIKLQLQMEEETPDMILKKAIRDVKKSGLSMRGAAKRHGIPYKKIFEEMAKSNSAIRDKQGYRGYSMANLQRAMKSVKDKKMTCHTASKKFGVPYSTLHDRVVERVNPDVFSPGPQPLLGPVEEDKVADFLQYMSLLGYRFQQKEVQAFVTTYAHKKKILDPGRALSEAWYRHFMKRHKRAFPEIDLSRKPVADTKFVNRYFTDLYEIMSRFKLLEKPELVFNVDEVEIDLPYKVTYKLLTIKNAHLRRVTIIACGNAQGESLPPYFIYRGQHKFNQCHLKHAPAGSQGRSTLSRHTSPEVLQRYLHEHLIPSVNEDDESPALVLFDAFKMKVTEQQIAWARDNRVILFPLPPGLRAESKSSEVGILQNFRQCFEKTFKAYTSCHPGSTVNKYNICGLAGGVYEDVIAPGCLASHFRRMGIVPLNPKAVDLEARYPNKSRRGAPVKKEPEETDEADEFLISQNPFLLLKQDLGRQVFTKQNKRKADSEVKLKIKKSRINESRYGTYNTDDEDDDDDSDDDDDNNEMETERVEEDGSFADVPIAGLSYPSSLHTVGDWSGYAAVMGEERRARMTATEMAGVTSRTSALCRNTKKVMSLQEFQQPAATEQAVQTITDQRGSSSEILSVPFSCLTLSLSVPFSCLTLSLSVPFSCLTLSLSVPFSCLTLSLSVPFSCLCLSLVSHCLCLSLSLVSHCLCLSLSLVSHCLCLSLSFVSHSLSAPFSSHTVPFSCLTLSLSLVSHCLFLLSHTVSFCPFLLSHTLFLSLSLVSHCLFLSLSLVSHCLFLSLSLVSHCPFLLSHTVPFSCLTLSLSVPFSCLTLSLSVPFSSVYLSSCHYALFFSGIVCLSVLTLSISVSVFLFSLCLYLCLSVCSHFVYICVCLSVLTLSISVSVFLSISVSVCLFSLCLYLCLSFCLYLCLSVLSLSISVPLCFHFVYICVCLSVLTLSISVSVCKHFHSATAKCHGWLASPQTTPPPPLPP